MSTSSTLDIYFSNKSIDTFQVFTALRLGGWTPVFENEIVYLPLNDNDEFNWTSASSSEEIKVEMELKRKSEVGEMLGITLVWQDSMCGGEFLIFPGGKVSINLSLNRRPIAQFERSTDISWYVNAILISLRDSPFQVESIVWREHI